MDAQARLLLLHIHERNVQYPEYTHFWVMPGGGLEAAESYEQALVREAQEAIGLELDFIGPWVWTETFVTQFEKATVRFDVRYNYVRVQDHCVDMSGMEPHEQDNLRGYRWWSLAEMRATEDLLLPRGLPDLLASLADGEIPAQPIQLIHTRP